MTWRAFPVALACAACARAPAQPAALPVAPADTSPPPVATAPVVERPGVRPRPGILVPPDAAFRAGWMPLASTGVERFRARHPTDDGRGVVIGILDSGLDPGLPGLRLTSEGSGKILDVRDFSGEGAVALTPTAAGQGTLRIGGALLRGAGRIARITTATTWYVGELRERAFGPLPGSDLNGDGSNTDAFPLVVVKASEGWVVFLDTNLDGSFEDETPLHDYRVGHETLSLGTKPITLAANLDETDGVPSLTFFFDDAGHGTHVAGIAAGHNLFGVPGFDGVAPGAQLLGLKITNNARGGLAVTGSLERALQYAAHYTETRGLALVLNLSFGTGSQNPAGAVIDSVIDAFLAAHPAVVLVASAGNDGPGFSTVGVPGAADLALTAGASFPAAFANLPLQSPRTADVVGWWSARGGTLDKPDLVAPGVAYSAVPAFQRGGELKAGTSMSAPYAAGLAACLMSAMAQEGRQASAIEIIQALRASAGHLAGGSVVDEGAGEPELERAYRWLAAEHQGSQYSVRTADGVSAAFFRNGLSADSGSLFHVRSLAGLRAAAFLLRRDATWVEVPPAVAAGATETLIPVRYSLPRPLGAGAYTGTVTAWNPTDTLAGPLFRLITTVVVPFDLGRAALMDTSRSIGAGRVARYFLEAPDSGATLTVSVTRADSLAERAMVRLYGPDGHPVPDSSEVDLTRGATATLEVSGEDLVPGVYELDVVAAQMARITVGVHAELAPVDLSFTDGVLEARNPRPHTAAGVLRQSVLGAARDFAVAGQGAAPETLVVASPAWATAVTVDVRLPQGDWDRLTGFSVAAIDSSGSSIAQDLLDGAFGRERFALPAGLRGQRLAIELLPAFATVGAPWHAQVRVAFLLPGPEPLGSDRAVSVVGGGRMVLGAVPTPVLAVPEGFHPLVAARLRPAVGGPDAVRRVLVPSP